MPIKPNHVRIYLGDFPEENRLLCEAENSDERIELAMMLAVDEFNSAPPFSSYEVRDFPFESLHMIGTVGHLLKGLGLQKTRNRLAYTTGGTTVDLENAATTYLQMAQDFMTRFKQETAKIKAHLNLESGYGIVNSEYRFVDFYYNRTQRTWIK